MRDMVQVRRSGGQSFRQAPDIQVGRSQFNRSHGVKTTFDASLLIPILVDEVLPGDTFTCRMNGFARVFSPLDAPIMDNIEIETFFFFVPNRLVWTNWEAFQGEHDDAGAQDVTYTVPVLSDGYTVAEGEIAHYFGIPIGLGTTTVDVNALPFRAYGLIYNEWFRDQNVVDSLDLTLSDADGANLGTNLPLRSAKKHDYFTSALPYLQKGSAVAIAFSEDADIHVGVGAGSTVSVYSDTDADDKLLDASLAQVDVSATAGSTTSQKLYANLQDLVGIPVNTLRESVAIQRLLERDARGGTRYVEKIKAQFGVTSPDYRLQRPEFLGGGKSFINVSPVANTSSTAGEDQGELRGIGTGVISGHGFAKSFTEHGYIIGLVRARGDLSYFQGLDRMWSRSTLYDFYVPALAHLGEQAILNKELFVSNNFTIDDVAFAYQERWAEYRFKKSLITGILDPNASGSLSFWHLAEDFASLPSFNQTFIEDQTPMSRVTTVDTAHDFLLDAWFDYRCARPMPVYSVPSLMAGRF